MGRGFISGLPIGPLASRPRMVGAVAAGVAAGALLAVFPVGLNSSTRAILAWNAFCAWFVVASLLSMAGQRDHDIQARAARQDDGRGMILGLVLLASAAGLAASGLELSQAKGDHGWDKALRVLLAFASVAGCWLLNQITFAWHYAHEYYTVEPNGSLRRGLKFPDDEHPDYWDFLHFSVIIGVAAQTADVSFTSKRLRRIGTVHSLLAFGFNTVVLALSINLWAGIF